MPLATCMDVTTEKEKTFLTDPAKVNMTMLEECIGNLSQQLLILDDDLIIDIFYLNTENVTMAIMNDIGRCLKRAGYTESYFLSQYDNNEFEEYRAQQALRDACDERHNSGSIIIVEGVGDNQASPIKKAQSPDNTKRYFADTIDQWWKSIHFAVMSLATLMNLQSNKKKTILTDPSKVNMTMFQGCIGNLGQQILILDDDRFLDIYCLDRDNVTKDITDGIGICLRNAGYFYAYIMTAYDEEIFANYKAKPSMLDAYNGRRDRGDVIIVEGVGDQELMYFDSECDKQNMVHSTWPFHFEVNTNRWTWIIDANAYMMKRCVEKILKQEILN